MKKPDPKELEQAIESFKQAVEKDALTVDTCTQRQVEHAEKRLWEEINRYSDLATGRSNL